MMMILRRKYIFIFCMFNFVLTLVFVTVILIDGSPFYYYRYWESQVLDKWNYNYRLCQFQSGIKGVTKNVWGLPQLDKSHPIKVALSPGTKTILQWTSYWGDYPTQDSVIHANDGKNLSQPCFLTANREHVESAEAVNFWMHDFCLSDIPSHRTKLQRYIFGMMEPPTFKLRDLRTIPEDFFNWTMTYRKDSDIIVTYGSYEPAGEMAETTAQMKNSTSTSSVFVTSKSKSVAWFVSRCFQPSKRDKLVNSLSQIVQVDIYGACGTKICPKIDNNYCKTLLNQDYRFYLALENSICDDYVTEKFWGSLKLNIVPIVFKRGMYRKIAPSNSFIAIDDYNSVEQLANHLQSLEDNAQEYQQYLSWKSTGYKIYQMKHSHFNQAICNKLWKDNGDSKANHKTYKTIADWWKKSENCDTDFVDNFLAKSAR